MTVSAPKCREPYNIPLAIDCRNEQMLCKKLMKGEIANPLAAVPLTGAEEVGETVRTIDTFFSMRLIQYRESLTLAMKKDDLVIQKLHTEAFATKINQVVLNYLGNNRITRFLCWFPTQIRALTTNEKDQAPNRLKWVIATYILEQQRLTDSLYLITGRINVIATEVFVNEFLDEGNLPDYQKNEYIQLRLVHDAMFPNLPSIQIRYKKLYTGMGSQLVTDKTGSWKERLELLRDFFQLIELTNADLELNSKSVEEIIEKE